MHRKIIKFKFNIIKILISIYCILKYPFCKASIGIVSCDKWKNKIGEDIRLRYYLARNNLYSKIISWNNDNCTKYDILVIRSIWGSDSTKFREWLNSLDANQKVINDKEIININYSKKSQYDLLEKYNIKHISTEFIKNDKDRIKKILCSNTQKDFVVKPTISESGENTYIISHNSSLKNSMTLDTFLKEKYNDSIEYMIQPYMKEINKGEISVIMLGNKISHSVLRYPGIFTKENTVKQISNDKISKKILNIIEKITNIDELNNSTYSRIDFVCDNDKYLVLELEFIDPMLFIGCILDRKERTDAYKKFANEIKKRIS